MTKKSLFTRVFHENENQPLHVENSWLKREKKAGKADHVVASALRALTITKATNSIFDLIFTLIKKPNERYFSNTPQPYRNSNQGSYLSSIFLPPTPPPQKCLIPSVGTMKHGATTRCRKVALRLHVITNRLGL